jgi:amino acid permease
LFKDRDYKFFFTNKVFSLLRLIVIAIMVYLLFDKIILIIDKIVELGIYTAIIILLLIAFSFYQKKSNGTKVEYMSEHIKQLELKQDPKRGSSSLTKQGNTNPIDE